AARYAVVASGGRLLCEVKCSPRDMIVVLAHREDGEWGYPHATYHVDGTIHVRSTGETYVEVKGLPRLDQPVKAPVNVFALTIRPEDASRIQPSPERLTTYADVIEVPSNLLEHQVLISTDIVVPGQAAPAQVFCEKTFERDLAGTDPPVRITIWKV